MPQSCPGDPPPPAAPLLKMLLPPGPIDDSPACPCVHSYLVVPEHGCSGPRKPLAAMVKVPSTVMAPVTSIARMPPVVPFHGGAARTWPAITSRLAYVSTSTACA